MSRRQCRPVRPARIVALIVVASASLGVLMLPAAGMASAGMASARMASARMPATGASPALSPNQTSASPSASPTPTTTSPSPSTSPSASPTPTKTPKPKPSKSPKPSPTGKPTAPAGGGVFTGTQLWDPAKNKRLPYDSYVTVSQVSNLVNQVVKVTWRNFTPSSSETYTPTSTNYPVMVAECTGTHPTRFSQCFGADNAGVAGTTSPYGPMNTAYATTSPKGTGETYIELLTAEQDSQLGCNIGHPCSLVIVPAQGGNVFDTPADCSDHSQDLGETAIGTVAFTSLFGTCSWRDRIIVPLTFQRTPTDCPIRNPDFKVIGSPMLARAMNSWQSALCSAASPISIQYDSAQSEPLARTDFQSGADDVALTTLPASGSSVHPYTYAPVAISAESIAYWIDNPTTGLPLTHLKLDPRLVLKLLTQSYNFENEGCGHGVVQTKGIGCDNAVDNDPETLFADPEFQQLNPHVATVGDGYQVPTVLSGESDMTWELTRWIAANSAAKAFADGAFDPWGEHINTDYLGMQLPTNSLSSMDPYPPIAHRYSPVFPLSSVANYQVENWEPATAYSPDFYGNYDALMPEIPGNRALFAILDEGDAAAFDLPTAAIENADGKYVTPTDASMTAALSEMYTDGNGITQTLRMNAKNPDAYPLTMVIYAMVPTGGIGKKKAQKIAQWLDYVANQGQQSGYGVGQLPPGYLPLTAKMRAQTLKAASEVLHQTGNAGKKASATPAATAAPKPEPSHASVSLGFVSNPFTSGVAKFAVPILLIAGALLAVAGTFSLAIGRGSTAVLVRLRKSRLGQSRLGQSRLGQSRLAQSRLARLRLPRRRKS